MASPLQTNIQSAASVRGGLGTMLDRATEILLYAMIVFSPWAFGTTQPWSIWCMNMGGYALGALLVAKIFLRGRATWQSDVRGRRLTFWLFILTISILGYIFISAINAEFTYVASEWRQEPHAHVDWLPHSLDQNATWQIFWNWLALAGVFWAVHDWLLGDVLPDGPPRNRRLRRLLFVLAANAALVAFQGILQQNSGTAKLLWFKVASNNRSASAQFGPYNYRSNAAQLFNLIWPAALGLWWHLQLQLRRPTQRHHWLLPCVMLLIAGPLVSLSRAGVAVTLVQLLACGLLLIACGKFSATSRLAIVAVFAITIGAAAYAGWSGIAQRFQETAADPLVGRRETYELAKRMAADYPWFGVGPGAYDSTFQLYRNSPTDYWPAQLHNDWLEFLITFGRVGFAMLLGVLALLACRWFVAGGLRTHWTFAAFLWIALGGCLLHARVDFPLQVYSVQFVFVLVSAIIFSVARRV